MSQTKPNMSKKNSTFFLTKEQASASRMWIEIDAKGKNLGRLASEIVKVLTGKHKPSYTQHIDCGDGVIVLNGDKISVTGAKESNKIYHYYTGHIGGHREVPYTVMKSRKPEYILMHAVKGMMPKTKLGKAQLKRLRIFAQDHHDMQAQQPIQVSI